MKEIKKNKYNNIIFFFNYYKRKILKGKGKEKTQKKNGR
jgi:hypothetical protein